MKHSFFFLLASLILTSSPKAQSRSAGQMVVPIGWENQDSVRWNLYGTTSANQSATHLEGERVADSALANSSSNFGGYPANYPRYGKRKTSHGYGFLEMWDVATWSLRGATEAFHPFDVGESLKEREYYTWPQQRPSIRNPMNGWRYNDVNINRSAQFYNNTYDANDISPYSEYPRNDTIVDQTFTSLRSGISKSYFYSNEGRVVLGYSDDRDAKSLLFTPMDYPFRPFDSAKAFSATFYFNIDTLHGINVSHWPGRDTNSAPLMRIQILFKPAGQAILPFVPFKTLQDTTKIGWYVIKDTTITRQSYKLLNDSWKSEDVLNGNSSTPAHSWKFKQLHLLVDTMPYALKSIIQTYSSDSVVMYGEASTDTAITRYWHPDSLVSNGGLLDHRFGILEMRILSTYRATVRVRSMEWRDTTEDNFYYRKRITADSTTSLTPYGVPGGYDSAVLAVYRNTYDSLTQRPVEDEWNDTRGRWGDLCLPAIGYLEAMGSKFQIYTHIHDQDFGSFSRELRREKLSYDGKPPSMLENIVGAPKPWIFPRDYVYNALAPDGSHVWPLSHTDSMLNCFVSRGDSSYQLYTSQIDGMGFLRWLRWSAIVALRHPASRRFAIESSPFGWGAVRTGHRDSSGHLVFYGSPIYATDAGRPTTPEENTAQIFGAFANGITAFSNAQPFNMDDGGGLEGGGLGIAGVKYHTNFDLTSNYNFGHRYSGFTLGKYHDLDTLIPEYFLGYAANFRSQRYAISRIDQLYDTIGGNKYPLKHFTWMDAYSAHGALGRIANQALDNSSDRVLDTTSYHSAFLKITATKPVNALVRGSNRAYLDLSTVDDSNKTFVEVGLFIDSSGSSPKYAALLVNTRTFPSLKDTDELYRYSVGLDRLQDQPTSSMGDIDVRKVYMKLDTAQFTSSFKTTYYIVRDLWHQDSSWLVHRDSTFAVYIKPGDAKFLYFEKGIAIDAAKNSRGDTGKSDAAEFCFNNGNRIAERLHGTKSVVTYTRNHRLYAAFPAAGSTFAGMPEQSSGDNIATGFEIPLDTTHFCVRPSIRVGRNDTCIGLAYARKVDTSWEVLFAFQRRPDSPWYSHVIANTPLLDATADYSMITPDVSPYSNDTWLVSFGDHGHAPPRGNGITIASVYVSPTTVIRDTGLGGMVVEDIDHFLPGGVDPNSLALFMSLGTRPLDDTLFPVRAAWQLGIPGNHAIYFATYRLWEGSTEEVELKNVSMGLAACDNLHPHLALNGTIQRLFTGVEAGDGLNSYDQYGHLVKIGSGYKSVTFYDDNVVWEAKFSRPGMQSGSNYFPVIRARHQNIASTFGTPFWGVFDIFRSIGSGPIDTSFSDYHYPVISAQPRRYDGKFAYNSFGSTSSWRDWIRATWQDKASVRFASWAPGWQITTLGELGRLPSLGQTTDSMTHWTDSSTVPRSIVFLTPDTNAHGFNQVRITNGLFPFINLGATPVLHIPFIDTNYVDTCVNRGIVERHDPPELAPHDPTKSLTPIPWSPVDFSQPAIIEDWSPANPWTTHTMYFVINSLDQITVHRTFLQADVPFIQSHLTLGDYVQQRITLRHYSDSSVIATVDSLAIAPGAARWPGITTGLDSSNVTYTVPFGHAQDTVFVSLEVWHADSADHLARFLEEDLDSVSDGPALKRSTRSSATASAGLQLSIHPNPSAGLTAIEFSSFDGQATKIELFDILGNRVSELFTGEGSQTGTVELDASKLPSGAYLVRLSSAGQVLTKKLVLEK